METRYGEIKLVVENAGVSKFNKPYTRYEFEMADGRKYSTFEDSIGKKFKPGDNVAITGEQKGDYWTMVGMELAKSVPKSPPNQSYMASRETSIIAQTMVKALAESNSNLTKEQIYEAYEFFVNKLDGKPQN